MRIERLKSYTRLLGGCLPNNNATNCTNCPISSVCIARHTWLLLVERYPHEKDHLSELAIVRAMTEATISIFRRSYSNSNPIAQVN